MTRTFTDRFTPSKNKPDHANNGSRSRSPSQTRLRKSPRASPDPSDSTPPIPSLSQSFSVLDLRDSRSSDRRSHSPVSSCGNRSVSHGSRQHPRSFSPAARAISGSRPQTPDSVMLSGSNPNSMKASPKVTKGKGRSWLNGKLDKDSKDEEDHASSQAWIAGLKEHIPYDLTPLLNGQPTVELWHDDGDVLVFLFPKTIAKGPSFKVSSALFADSRLLQYLYRSVAPNLHSQQYVHSAAYAYPVQNFSNPRTIPYNPRPLQEKLLHLPLELDGDYSAPGSVPNRDDLELILLYRNFFSFLSGGALVATKRQTSLYAIFTGIASILARLQYGNEKGSSWGTVPWSSFSSYTEELRLADVRSSREKIIQALILGEAMRSWPLYNEGFAHAVGRLQDIKSTKSIKLGKISPITLNRLERASLDLEQRIKSVRVRLDNFDFPSMFAGIANSQTATEAKLVRFKAWKQAFMDFRSFTMTQYKRRYGAWPPKASSKKNNFEESGLNRRLLQEVYQDFTDLYDMLVDRTQLTTRSADMPTLAEDATGGNETIQHALRVIEGEYDRSTPPVLPPIPFDVPQIPAYANSFNREHVMLRKYPANSKKLKDTEITALLLGSYNRGNIKPTIFCQDFVDYERKLGSGQSVQALIDNRCGHWLFLYAVLQCLPMLVVDARDLQFTDGVEYFLCMAPRGGRPWMKEDTSSSRAWYNVASGGGLISLPADMIDHGVEGIFRRSHCYTVANQWAEAMPHGPIARAIPDIVGAQTRTSPNSQDYQHDYHTPSSNPSTSSPFLSPYQPVSNQSSPFASPMARPSSRTSTRFGLEETQGPQAESSKPAAVSNPTVTFDDILGRNSEETKKGKVRKK